MMNLFQAISDHLSQIGLLLLAVNTTFQKLPVAGQDDLIALGLRGAVWLWSKITAKMTTEQKTMLDSELKAFIAEVVKAEMVKGRTDESH